jgi:two-component system phosphate regulon sensor histidine kinase PhoR
MWRRRLFAKLFFTYSLINLVCLAVVGGYLFVRERNLARQHLEEQLARIATLVDERLAELLRQDRFAAVDSLAKALGPTIATRITVIAADGTVIGDSDALPARMENHRFRPEVQEAAHGRVGSSVRLSTSANREYLYVATPSRTRPGWVVRAALPLVEYQRRVRTAALLLGAGGLVVCVLAMGLGLVFTGRITRPLEAMQRNLERLEKGEFGVRLELDSTDEVGQLARTVNRVQEQLESTIQGVTAQYAQREAILASMVEGLVAVDPDDRILLLNASARAVLGIDAAAEGRRLVEVIRNPILVDFVQAVRASGEPLIREMRLPSRILWLELHGAPVRFDGRDRPGAVVVLNDVTRVRKLEQTRKDFVANVSHELKTPITTIRGFVDTLLERGALDDPASAKRFLGIVSKQTTRLSSIVDDLLYLSRLEHEDAEIPMHTLNLGLVVTASVGNFDLMAREKNVALELKLHAQPIAIRGNASLLTRAVDNLIENAIKYSPSGTRVQVTVRHGSGSVILEVRDEGIGIPEEHLPRITERFYRVDPARSREMGGTGLGLAIVKHVAIVHRGRFNVESKLGKGSTFSLEFPSDDSGVGETVPERGLPPAKA